MDDEELELGFAIEAAAVRKIDWLIIGVDFVRRLVSEVETGLSNVEQMLCSHANHTAEQQAFADAARLDIETLTQEE